MQSVPKERVVTIYLVRPECLTSDFIATKDHELAEHLLRQSQDVMLDDFLDRVDSQGREDDYEFLCSRAVSGMLGLDPKAEIHEIQVVVK